MRKTKGPSFVLTLKLNTNVRDEGILQERFFAGFLMYNRLVRHARGRLSGMRQDPRYRKAMQEYVGIKGTSPEDKRRRNEVSVTLRDIRQEYGLSEYQFHAWIAVSQHRYCKKIDSLTAQKIATRVWQAVETVLFRKGKSVHFQKFDRFLSLEGKNNASGIRFSHGRMEWLGLSIQPQIREGDDYAREAMAYRVKYCRITRKAMGISWHYYLQLVLEGAPPEKHRILPEGRVGIDPGTATEAVASESGCILTELAPERKDISATVRRLQRSQDRSRKACNPGNYNPDGTVKARGQRKKWLSSKRSRETAMRLRTVRRRNADTVKQSEERLVNEILSHHGSDIFTEKMDYKALQAKAKEASVDETTGRFRSRKRFGASLAGHAPSRFLTILERKLSYAGKTVQYVDTWKFRASQYDHVSGTYEKPKLSERWKDIGGHAVQRDLYSAFLLMNAKDPEHPDREMCLNAFPGFLKNHDACILRIKNNTASKPSSFGIA